MPEKIFRGKIDLDYKTDLRDHLLREGFKILSAKYVLWQAKKDRIFIMFYQMNFLVVCQMI